MDITITPTVLQGNISAIPSKSQTHRYLICAAFADKPAELLGASSSRDIDATIDCLHSLGAKITKTALGFLVYPVQKLPKETVMHCAESGSTLRFMLPVVGALGIDATFIMNGRLPQRPLSPLWKEMERMGCQLTWLNSNRLRCTGQLRSGEYRIQGNISSQFITGLLFGCSLISGHSKISVIGKLESKPYVDMTVNTLSAFGISAFDLALDGRLLRTPGSIQIEGDWSNAACFLAANTMGSRLNVEGLSLDSFQGDREISTILQHLDDHIRIDVSNIPDLVPILAVAAASKQGATFQNTHRLRLKESDRVESVCSLLRNLGCRTKTLENSFTVYPGSFGSCTVDACNDHRIAMAAAIAATIADGPVTILGAECVEKSYPGFWTDYRKLGGNYEQHIR